MNTASADRSSDRGAGLLSPLPHGVRRLNQLSYPVTFGHEDHHKSAVQWLVTSNIEHMNERMRGPERRTQVLEICGARVRRSRAARGPHDLGMPLGNLPVRG